MKGITALMDFLDICFMSLELGFEISEGESSATSLLSRSNEIENNTKVQAEIKKYAVVLVDNNVDYLLHLAHENFFLPVQNTVARKGSDMVLIGVHGKSSSTQKDSSYNILKLIQLLKVSTLAIQNTSFFKEDGLNRVLLPVFLNKGFEHIKRKFLEFAILFISTICLYILGVHDNACAFEVRKNLKKAKVILEKERLKFEHCCNELLRFSICYARQILKFTAFNKMSIIPILPKVNTLNGKVDKENIFLNKNGLPVFYINDLILAYG